MRCPKCDNKTKTTDSRLMCDVMAIPKQLLTEENAVVRSRRCLQSKCGHSFKTKELEI
jgi:transcriptional regulator NrdR family protein